MIISDNLSTSYCLILTLSLHLHCYSKVTHIHNSSFLGVFHVLSVSPNNFKRTFNTLWRIIVWLVGCVFKKLFISINFSFLFIPFFYSCSNGKNKRKKIKNTFKEVNLSVCETDPSLNFLGYFSRILFQKTNLFSFVL